MTAPDVSNSLQAPRAAQREHLSWWHGERVDDPWFWLRERDNPEVLAYLRAENAYTEAMTADLAPLRDQLYAEMLGRIQQTDLDVPVRRGAWCYYTRTVEGQQYPIRCRRAAGADGREDALAAEQVLLDQNALAAGRAFLSIGDVRVSDDGHGLLYTTDDSGYRQYTLWRKHLDSGRVDGPLAERVTSVEWAADNATVFFTTEHPVTKRSDTLWRLPPGGTPQRLWEETDELYDIGLSRSKDRRLLVLSATSTDTWECRVLEADRPEGEFRVVLPRRKGHKYELEHHEGRYLIRTNDGAKDFRLVWAPMADPSVAHWQPLLDPQPGVLLEDVDVFRSHLVVQEKVLGLVRFRVLDLATGQWATVPFDESAYAASLGATPEYSSTNFRYHYQSLVTPASVVDVDLASLQPTLRKRQAVLGGYVPERYQTERLWAVARDGVRVPISIVWRRDRARDGTQPLWLVGYGAYGYARPANFASWVLSLLDRGVAFAIAHVRGGDELGEAWHDDGMLMAKANTFADFIDCAEHLVRERWTSPARLLIEGGSAGGLLMGVVANQRPELFCAVHAAVPFVDVMNTMMDPSLPLTVGEYLEWGNPNERAAFDAMRAYSPYDNLRRQDYPAVLVTTSYNDSQVMYWESAKYVAKLRTLKTDGRPLLLKTKLEPAGHGGASGRYDALRDKAFEVAWMLRQAGVVG